MREHRLGVQLCGVIVLDVVQFCNRRRLGLVRHWFDAILCFLHDILVLKAFDVSHLTLHVCIEEGTSLTMC